MSVLKKIGQALLKGGEWAAQLLQIPFVGAILGGIATKIGTTATGIVSTITTGIGDLNSIAGILGTAEVMFPAVSGAKTGSAKLQAASPLVQQALLTWAQSNLPGHSKLKVDPTVFAAHVQAFTSSFADILNDFGD